MQRGQAFPEGQTSMRVMEFADRTVRIEDGLIAGAGTPDAMPARELSAHAFPRNSSNLAGFFADPLEYSI